MLVKLMLLCVLAVGMACFLGRGYVLGNVILANMGIIVEICMGILVYVDPVVLLVKLASTPNPHAPAVYSTSTSSPPPQPQSAPPNAPPTTTTLPHPPKPAKNAATQTATPAHHPQTQQTPPSSSNNVLNA